MNYKKQLFLATMLGMFSLVYSSETLLKQKAPLFTAQAVFPPSHDIKDFSLKKYIGKKIVLYFYPMDSTPGCTKQAKKFREDMDELKKHGITVIGVSCDSVKSHQKFQEKYEIPYILVSDSRWSRTISKMYNAAGFLYSQRKTFLINEKGTIIHIFEHVNINTQVDEILEIFKKSKCKK